MAMYAPESPTTDELHSQHPLGDLTEWKIEQTRSRQSELYRGDERGFVARLGPCAMKGDLDIADIYAREGDEMEALTLSTDGLLFEQRLCPWKPRSNPADWHGEETTEPLGAYRTIARQAINGPGVSMEIGSVAHAKRYGHMLVSAWFGGRMVENIAMMRQVALMHPSLPLAVKNGLNGEVGLALDNIYELNELREMHHGTDAAPVVLLYRGGENAQTPELWEENYVRAYEITKGRMNLDVAHGTEMAHDPAGNFQKSVEGQDAALDHMLTLAEDGIIPIGLTAEACNAPRVMDPHSVYEKARDISLRMHELCMNGTKAMAAV